MKTLSQVSSDLGIICLFKDSFEISSKGEILAIHKSPEEKYQLVRQNLDTKKSVFYRFQHESFCCCVLLFEKNNLVLSGGWDWYLAAFNLRNGSLLKIIDLDFGRINCLFKANAIVFVGGENTIQFLDSRNLMEITTKEKVIVNCQFVKCMNLNLSLREKHFQDQFQTSPVLIFGGFGNSHAHIYTSTFPQEVYHKFGTSINLQNRKFESGF